VLLAGAVVALVIIAAKPVLAGGSPIIATGPLTNRFPVAAVQYLQKNLEAVTGEMFNDYGWGGYLMLVLPERKVFIDGRMDFYGDVLVNEFNEVNDVRPGWERVFKEYRVGWTILPAKHTLNSVLALHPAWKLIYSDEVAVIYAHEPSALGNRSAPIGTVWLECKKFDAMMAKHTNWLTVVSKYGVRCTSLFRRT
jgi:hypothetical protein